MKKYSQYSQFAANWLLKEMMRKAFPAFLPEQSSVSGPSFYRHSKSLALQACTWLTFIACGHTGFSVTPGCVVSQCPSSSSTNRPSSRSLGLFSS